MSRPRLTRDGLLPRLGVLLVIGVMTAQTLCLSRLGVFGDLAKSAFQRWFGLPCPLCGGTWAMRALFAGDLARALYLNWLALPVLVIGVLAVVVIGVELITRRRWLPPVRIGRRGAALAAAVFVLLWGWQIFQSLHAPKPELLNPNGLFFKFYKFPENR